MKIRSTENNHLFTNTLYRNLSAYHLEGLTMDTHRNFTAAVEAVELEANEEIHVSEIFTEDELRAKYLLATSIQVPLFIITCRIDEFIIYNVSLDSNQHIFFKEVLVCDSNGFVNWWAQIKKTKQPHPLLNGGQYRAGRTIFDGLIEAAGQAWGGNIDGFVIRNNKIVAIIDNISIGFTRIENEVADPARFFHKKGPKYTTWLSTVKLAKQLNVPHILLTIDAKNPTSEVVGMSVIKHLDPSGIYYNNNVTPPNNILRGMGNITNIINKAIQESNPPTFR